MPASRRAPRRPAAAHVAALFAALGATGAPASPLTAQRIDSLPAGARVRLVLARARPVRDATYLRADSAGLAVTSGDGAVATYAWRDVRRVERPAAPLTSGQAFERGARRGALVGAALTAAGVLVAAYSDARRPCRCGFSSTAGVGAVGALYTGVFAVVGGTLGLGHRAQWAAVRLRP